jgi:hypothetical protein
VPFDIREAVDLTEYAVPLRYEDLLDAKPLNRDATVALVGDVGRWATAQLSAATEGDQVSEGGEEPGLESDNVAR